MPHELNSRIADRLRLMAELRSEQGDNGFRVGAYRRAADAVDALDEPVDELFSREGRAGLVALPAVGEGIASAIAEMLLTGRWAQLDRLTGTLEPEALFRTLPGIGPKLAERLHEALDVETLEQLEVAAHDGRLDAMEGMGPRRAAAIRMALQDRLGRRRIRAQALNLPPLKLALAVDAAYRRAAAAGKLRKIAPKRFNPEGEAWLPVMHEDADGWHITALYSNTARAHQLHKTRDWVVLYAHAGAGPEVQCTIVTETHGALKGKRVVRGREAECQAFYEAQSMEKAE